MGIQSNGSGQQVPMGNLTHRPVMPKGETMEPAGRPPLRTSEAASAETPSLHGEILTKLRDYIVESNLPEGARIPERQLCEMFGISRTPVREALKVLASEGLVNLLPNRGSRIRSLSEQDICDLFDLMGGLESLAGRLACERITEEEVAEIERLHHEMYAFYLRRELHGYFRINRLIHERIVAAARNPTLATTYASHAGRLRGARFSPNSVADQDRLSAAMREHEAILDALRRRAGTELSDILFLHLRHKRIGVLSHLSMARSGHS
jgi:DNA-binding GntR family transcriptional regulator